MYVSVYPEQARCTNNVLLLWVTGRRDGNMFADSLLISSVWNFREMSQTMQTNNSVKNTISSTWITIKVNSRKYFKRTYKFPECNVYHISYVIICSFYFFLKYFSEVNYVIVFPLKYFKWIIVFYYWFNTLTTDDSVQRFSLTIS